MMTRIYMIRHGKAATGWDGDADPGLADLGLAQAVTLADTVRAFVPTSTTNPASVFSSPLKRCRQTAAPLAMALDVPLQIEEGVSEIPSPLEDLTERTQWLRRVMSGTWQDLYEDEVSVESGVDFRGWYNDVAATLNGMAKLGPHVVVFSHFIALNVAYCVAQDAQDETQNVVSFSPANGSVTIFETDGEKLSLVQLGEETDDIKIALGKKA